MFIFLSGIYILIEERMSNKDLCISIIDILTEDQLANVAVMLKSVKHLLDEAADDAYCLNLYNEYLHDPDPEKHDSLLLESFAEGIGVSLT
jgi:hypothetical protein